MPSNEVALNTGQQAIINTDLSQIFVWGNRYDKATYTATNSTYDDVTIPAGTLMGKVSADQKTVPLESGASDGSQIPYGILAQDIVILAGTTYDKPVAICIEGDVVEAKVILQGSDTMATVIDGRSIRDRIGGDTVGVRLITSTDLTNYDNQ